MPFLWLQKSGAVDHSDMNVRPAWAMGYSGRGVSVSILDDGIQLDHPDLARNYDAHASTDINNHDDDPTPRDNGENKHGTRCAGEVAAIAGNDQCGVGIAFNASIGGVRMLDGPVSDSVEAAALGLNQDHIDIYSASWGPEDDGATFDGPGPLARKAFTRGILQVIVTSHSRTLLAGPRRQGQHLRVGVGQRRPALRLVLGRRLHDQHLHAVDQLGHVRQRPTVVPGGVPVDDRHHLLVVVDEPAGDRHCRRAQRLHRPTHGHQCQCAHRSRHHRTGVGGEVGGCCMESHDSAVHI